MMTPSTKLTKAGITSLIILQLTMLLALFFGVAPHPPKVFPISGMAPFLAVSFSFLFAALIVDPLETWAGRIFTMLAIPMALISFGPQKYFDPQWPVIWPAVLCAQAAVLLLAFQLTAAIANDRKQKA